MDMYEKIRVVSLVLFFVYAFVSGGNAQESGTIFPAIISFGDSGVDVGNNNYLPTLFKSNFLPYGKDFITHQPTGRFSNGKLAIDFTAEYLGFKSYAPAYLSPQASGKNLLNGVNFGSAGSGFDESAVISNYAIPLSQQLKYFKEYKIKLAKIAGSKRAASIINDSLYILSAGTADFIQNYYFNASLRNAYTPLQYSSYLVGFFSSFVKELYGLGGRKIGVTSLPPLGCVPAAKTLFGFHEKGCLSRFNSDAHAFNEKLNNSLVNLKKQLPGLKIVVFDTFNPIYDAVRSPFKYGFEEARRGCCRSKKGVEKTSVLCNPKSSKLGTCLNSSQYVFWDDIHLSQAANQIVSEAMLLQGFALA